MTEGEEGNGGGRPGFELGAYVALVMDDAGKVVERFEMVAEAKLPAIGEALDIVRGDGSVSAFRVVDVRHEEKETEHYVARRYTGLLVILGKDDRPRPSGGEPVPKRDQTPPPSTPKALAVIDFSGKLPSPSSRLFNFAKLLSWIVATGYREQRVQLEGLKFLAWQLRWDGRRWLLAQVTCDRSPEELRELSRAAKRAGADAEQFFEQLLLVPAGETDEQAKIIHLDAYRR